MGLPKGKNGLKGQTNKFIIFKNKSNVDYSFASLKGTTREEKAVFMG